MGALLAAPLGTASVACGQQPAAERAATDTAPPPIARELRAAWVATVDNIDWPSKKGLSTWAQQRELLAILDKLVELRMNAVVLQVRPAADALYQSGIEPWSDFLTGEMGRAPSPYYDPLAFAVEEAHKRGIELHVWINPYRAKHPATRSVAPGHISRARPELVRAYGPYLWMDPGDPLVREQTRRVVFDLVKRYDIDAVHMDDYFYPYPEVRNGREIPFPDDATYRRYTRGGGTLARDDWRRQNVDVLVKELYDGIHEIKPWVRFGISPFGIWRPGYPSMVRGLDQYAVLYADARKWLREGWVDYFTPQLYWPIDRPQQPYVPLLSWWAENNLKGRHLWPGNYTSKVGFTNAQKFSVDEVVRQVRLTRSTAGATGNVHFSMEVFRDNPDSLNERLAREVYAQPALVPATSWLKGTTVPRPAPALRVDAVSGATMVELRTAGGAAAPWLWVVQARTAAGWTTETIPGTERSRAVAGRGVPAPLAVHVTAVDRLGNASGAVRAR